MLEVGAVLQSGLPLDSPYTSCPSSVLCCCSALFYEALGWGACVCVCVCACVCVCVCVVLLLLLLFGVVTVVLCVVVLVWGFSKGFVDPNTVLPQHIPNIVTISCRGDD